jgi:hypothetical protein
MKYSYPVAVATWLIGIASASPYVPPARPADIRLRNGRCGLHVRQHKKFNNGFNLGIWVHDKDKTPIASREAFAVQGEEFHVTSHLMYYELIVTPGREKNDPIKFRYGSREWSSDDYWGEDEDAVCEMGAYHDGDRDGDCVFWC